MLGDSDSLLTSNNGSYREKISNETLSLKDIWDQIDLVDIYKTFHSKTAEHTFFSSGRGTSSRIDHMLGHKTSLNKFKKIEITSRIFSDHNLVKQEINYKKKTGKNDKCV